MWKFDAWRSNAWAVTFCKNAADGEHGLYFVASQMSLVHFSETDVLSAAAAHAL